nr:hypothetical protein [Hymenobacter sp. IS2118]
MQDFAFPLQLKHGPELLGQRHRAVAHQPQVHQLNLLLLQGAQVVVDAGAQVFGGVEGHPAFVGPAGGAHFRADNQAGRVGMQGLGNEPVGHVLAIIVGRVEEVDACSHGSFQNFQRLRAVIGLAPDVGAGEAHGAVAKARNGERLRGVLGNGDGRGHGSGDDGPPLVRLIRAQFLRPLPGWRL